MSADLLRALESAFKSDRYRVAIKAVVENSFTRHLKYSRGPLHAALIFGYANLETVNPESIKVKCRAFVFLNFRYGLLYGLRIDGDVDSALAGFPIIVNHLHDKPYDEATFAELENEINADMIGCTIRLFRHAPVCPDSNLCGVINRQYGAGQIKQFARRESIALSNLTIAKLDRHFGNVFNVNNPRIIKFRQGLDTGTMKMMGLIDQSFQVNTNQVSAYNWFNAGNPVHKRNRKQAALQVLWLLPVLAGLRSMPWMPERLCESSSSNKWQAVRQSINAAIDAGTPLFREIARQLNVPREVISWSRYRAFPEIESIKMDQVDILLRLLSSISPSMRPNDQDGWKRLDNWLN
jgi:hypothetical protein